MHHSLLLSELIPALEREGFVLGVDWHLRLRKLLEQLPEDAPQSLLQDAICTITAKDPEGQRKFAGIFREAVARAEALEASLDFSLPQVQAPADAHKVEDKIAPATRRWYVVAAAGLLLLLAAAWALWIWTRPKELPALQSNVLVYTGSNMLVQVDSTLLGDFGPLKRIHFDRPAGDTAWGRALALYSLADSGFLRVRVHEAPGRDTLPLMLENKSGQKRRLSLTVVVEKLEDKPLSVEKIPERASEIIHSLDTLPSTRKAREQELLKLEVGAVDPFQRWLWQYRTPLKAAALLLFGLLLAGILYWRERHRRPPLVAEQTRIDKPPYIWNIEIEQSGTPEMDEPFYTVLNRLRQRETEDLWRLDMPKTIDATIANRGFPDFRYRQLTRPPEYLLLIDRRDANDHRAALFNTLYEAFQAQEVLIDRYFFDGDPRICWNEQHPQGIGIRELLYRHPNARLLVFGAGYRMLNPGTGLPAGWTSLLQQWKQRSLFTPVSLGDWGQPERRLAELFTVLPASLSSLAWLSDLEEEDGSVGLFPLAGADENPQPTGPVPELLARSESAVARWIAGCAVWPGVHYELTRWIGEQIASGRSYRDLSALARLDWFVQGEIPKEARAELLQWLEDKDPALLRRLRGDLHRLLSQHPPPEDSAAWPDYRMNLAFLEWLSSADPQKKAELEKQIAQLLERGAKPDFTVLKYLDRPRNPLDFIVPKTWRRFVHPAGKPGLGWRGWWRDLLTWAAPLWLLALGAATFWPPLAPTDCSGEQVQWKGHTLCLNNAVDRVLYREVLAVERIEDTAVRAFDTTKSDSLTIFSYVDSLGIQVLQETGLHLRIVDMKGDSTIRQIVKKSLAMADTSVVRTFYKNIATAFYNKGVAFTYVADTLDHRIQIYFWFLQTTLKQEQIDYNRAQAQACAFFEHALAADSSLPTGARARAWCAHEAVALNIAPVISGMVVDAETGKPLRSMNVYVVEPALGVREVDGRLDGQFTLRMPKDYPKPTVTLLVKGTYYTDSIVTVTVDGRTVLPPIGLRRSVAPSRSYHVRGKVMDQTNALDLPDVSVRIQAYNLSSKTDTNGIFTLDLPRAVYPAQVEITFQASGYESNVIPVTLNRAADGETFFVDVVLTRKNKDDLKATIIPSTAKDNTDPQTPEVIIKATRKSGFTMVPVAGGTFTMGCKDGRDSDCGSDEKPAHEVTLSSFSIGMYEVTQADWQEIMGNNPSSFKNCDDCPVEQVSWDDIQEFLKKLNAQYPGKNYRLPTEAEWEYAARGGNQSNGYQYAGGNTLEDIGWVDSNSDAKTHVVGGKSANELGIFDMSGNVWEWCSDRYGDYTIDRQSNPTGATKDERRVYRGGSRIDFAQSCRVSIRDLNKPAVRFSYIGFRLASSLQ